MNLHVELEVRSEEIKHLSSHAFFCSKIAPEEEKNFSLEAIYCKESRRLWGDNSRGFGDESLGGKMSQSKCMRIGGGDDMMVVLRL